MTVPLARRLFTVKDYYRMAEAGILHEDDRVELIEGEIVEMPPIGSPHAGVVFRLNSLFSDLLTRDQAIVGVQSPVRLSDRSEPQPDVMLLRPRADFYASGHPRAEDVLLLIEVADTSIAYDREVKLPIYARERIAEVWIVDVNAGTVEVYRALTSGEYRVVRVAYRGESVSPSAFPEVELTTDAILG